MTVRKQFHFRPSEKGFFAWDVRRLIRLTQSLPVHEVNLATIGELDEAYWYGFGNIPSVKSIAEHARLIQAADFEFPIILSSDGRVMDGMHRVAKAIMLGHNKINAVRFDIDPEPDFKDVLPNQLDCAEEGSTLQH